MSTSPDEQLHGQTLYYVERGYAPDVAEKLARNDLRLFESWPGLSASDKDDG